MSEPKVIREKKIKEIARDDRREYQKPAIVHEQKLEARAGSPVPGSIDIIQMDSQE